MDKLIFATAGIPITTKPRTYKAAFEHLQKLGLGGLEVEFVRGVNMPTSTQEEIKKLISENGMTLSAHGPFYINLNSQEEDKVEASIKRILETARTAKNFGGYSITFHAAFYLKQDKQEVYKTVRNKFEEIISTLNNENNNIWIRPETTGKETQWGDLDEVIKLSNEFEQVLPCIDFSHLHARYAGKQYNTYDDFARVFERIGKEIGSYALENFHAHIAGIEYGAKGEKQHLMLAESDMNYKDLLRAFKNFNVKGLVVCESPIMEDDAILLKEYYDSI